MSLVEWIALREMADERGGLVAIEGGKDVPFPIRRVYAIQGVAAGASRGFHAHRALRQVAVCLAGSCRFVLDDGTRRQEAILDRPGRGLLIREMIWREMDRFAPGTVVMVLASDHYDEADYIRDYGVFTAETSRTNSF